MTSYQYSVILEASGKILYDNKFAYSRSSQQPIYQWVCGHPVRNNWEMGDRSNPVSKKQPSPFVKAEVKPGDAVYAHYDNRDTEQMFAWNVVCINHRNKWLAKGNYVTESVDFVIPVTLVTTPILGEYE